MPVYIQTSSTAVSCTKAYPIYIYWQVILASTEHNYLLVLHVHHTVFMDIIDVHLHVLAEQ
jgi:hypothetical protein